MDDQALKILLSILAAVLSGGISIAVYYLKVKIGAEKLTKALVLVEESVRYVEGVAVAMGWTSEEKKDAALAFLSGKLNLPEEEIEAYIEAAVARLKVAMEELKRPE